MQANVEIVSPAMAKEYLAKSHLNRPLSQATVDRYANDMADDLWINNGQGIVIAENGDLLDGQHRLTAIIKCGKAISMLVVRGAPKAAFVTMDSGKGRKLSDVLAIEGFKYRHNLAAASRAAYNYIAGVSPSYGPTRGVLEAFIRRHDYLVEMIDKVCASNARIPKTQVAAVLFLANEKRGLDKELEGFLEGIVYGERLWKGDARLTFREWYLRTYLADKTHKGGDAATMALFGAVARSWNAFAQGREMSIMRNHYLATRDTIEIFGYDQLLYGDVPDLAVKNRETAMRNLSHANKAQRLEVGESLQRELHQRAAAPPMSLDSNQVERDRQAAKDARDARMQVQAKALQRAARM